MKKWLFACVVSLCFGLPALPAADEKQAAAPVNHLASLERYLGEWELHGKWDSGEKLDARAIYEWGINKKNIVAKTYVMNGDKEYQRYEGIMAWHPKKKSLFEISFAYDGAVTEIILEEKDKDTLHIGYVPYNEGEPSPVRQILKFKDNDTFVWTVSLKAGEEWKRLIEAPWTRKKK